MGKLPDIVYGWVGIGAHTGMALKWGTYHPVCVRLAFGMCIPRTLWVGKVGLKDGLKWPSSATGPSPLGSMGQRAGQVKTRTNYQSWSICSAPWRKVHPYYLPTKQDTNHPQQQWSSRACWGQWQSNLLWIVIIRCGTTFFRQYDASLFLWHLSQGRQGGYFRHPHVTCSPTSSIWMSLGGTPYSRASPDARSYLHQKCFSSSTIIRHAIGI